MPPRSPAEPRLNYAYHFDAGLYARFLKRYSEALGVEHIAGKVASVEQHPETGDVTSLTLDDGRNVEGDFFFDCSGFRGLLIEQTLKTGYEDWSEWLPCNRAWAVQTEKYGPPTPFTRSTAQEAGWQWRIPLQRRTGNGYVFCNDFLSEQDAVDKLMTRLDAPTRTDPRMLSFTTGKRRKIWNKNVLALGLASGFLEPLESTSIHLVQSALAKFAVMMPRDRIDPAMVEQYNAMTATEYERIRDFIIAHYKVTERSGSDFWDRCRTMSIPDSLQERIDLFREGALYIEQPHDLFKQANWQAILLGQGLKPRSYHPAADRDNLSTLEQQIAGVRAVVERRAAALPTHEAFLTSMKEAR